MIPIDNSDNTLGPTLLVAAVVIIGIGAFLLNKHVVPEHRTKHMYSTYCNDKLILQNYYKAPEIKYRFLQYEYANAKYTISIDHCKELFIIMEDVPYLTPTPPRPE